MKAHTATLGLAWLLCLPALCSAQSRPAGTWVLGQSLPLSGPAYPTANRVIMGARAWVDKVNAQGGIQGQRIELVTLDDQADPARTAANVRTLVQQHGAVAILNCLGEQACGQAAQASQALGVPLVGTLSGAPGWRNGGMRQVFSLRASTAQEVRQLLAQLRSMGIVRTALLHDGHEPTNEAALMAQLRQGGVEVRAWPVGPQPDWAALFKRVVADAPQALLMSLGPASLDSLSHADPQGFEQLPPLVAATSTPGLTQLTRLFRRQAVGYTNVVPNPEISQLPLAREFERDVEAFSGPEAISFEGMAAYLHLRVCTEALRRVARPGDGAQLTQTLEQLGTLNIGGFVLRLGPQNHQGSDFVEVGLRSRDGRLRR